MKKELNYELLQFHVAEAAEEIDSLLLRIRAEHGERLSEDETELVSRRSPLGEAGLEGSLAHAYHHLNFAWNVRYKQTGEADRHFERDEKFPRAFARFWPKSLLRKTGKRKGNRK